MYLDFRINGLSGYMSEVKTKNYSTIQRIETLRADDKIQATLYEMVSSASKSIKTIYIEAKSIEGSYPTYVI